MRQLVIVTDPAAFPFSRPTHISTPDKSVPFHNAKSLLGQEFPFAIYDMRSDEAGCFHFNLDAFAIVAGTVQANGKLYLLCPDWQHLEALLDADARRWNQDQAVRCPNFFAYFKQLIKQFDWQICNEVAAVPATQSSPTAFQLTLDQQNILTNLPLDPAVIHLITAPRGRGKSTLAGKLAQHFLQQKPVILTARSQAVLGNFKKQCHSLPFFAPDALIKAIEQQSVSPDTVLFVDEAASLPLPMLLKYCAYFDKVILTTTTQNYEGTGRGFRLKFLPLLEKTARQWELHQPLRWQVGDKLEAFVAELLLLEDTPISSNPTQLEQHYRLLAQAHYKTTPTDLRRLFDGEQQQIFYPANNPQDAVIWAINEGGLDHALTNAILNGTRRPKGSLVAQYLAFQYQQPDFCLLHSTRISRIAVQPELQRKGIGKRLVADFILQVQQQKSPLVDFVSVSFGLTPELLRFWQLCGFKLLFITEKPEASSGNPSAMMIYPLSSAAENLLKYEFNSSKNENYQIDLIIANDRV